ncbi:MAG: CRISPR-associated protein Cas6 [Cyclobacteriaceae bacterium]
MRVRLTFEVQNRGGVVPFHHQSYLSQIFDSIIVKLSSNFQDYTFYCFSGLKGQTRLGKGGLKYSSKRVTVVITSANAEFIEDLIKQLLKAKGFQVGDLIIVPLSADEELPLGFSQEMKYLCISPIIPSLSHPDEIDPTSNEFSDLLYDATLNRMVDFGLDLSKIENIQKFQIIPDADYLARLKASNKVFSRVYTIVDKKEQELQLRGYTFPFRLFAMPEIQDFIYTCGLGLQCASGYGMLDGTNGQSINSTSPLLNRESVLLA